MLRSSLAVAALWVCSCSHAPAVSPVPATGLAARFPTPEKSWTIDVRGGQAKLLELVKSFEAASGERVVFSDAVGRELAAKSIGLTSNAQVVPERVYTWFESVIGSEGFRVAVATQTGPRVLTLWSRAAGTQSSETTPLHVDVGDLAELDLHPALYVQLVLDVTPLAARTLQNSLRALGERVDNLVTVGESNSVIVLGSGAQVVGMVHVLRAAMEQERARLAAAAGATGGNEKR